MGTQVATVYNASKQDMVLTSQISSGILVGAAELVLWLGDLALVPQLSAKEKLELCLAEIRERGAPIGGDVRTGAFFTDIDQASEAVVFFEAAVLPNPTESGCMVVYDSTGGGAGFQVPNSTEFRDGMFKKAWEKLLEEKLKLT